jgi:hypothetical protein
MTKAAEINETIVAQYVGLVEGDLQQDSYTAYGIASVLNKILARNDREPVRPQMMYNYARNGLIVKGEKVTGQTLRMFTKAEVATFIVRYALRNGITLTQGTDVNPDQLELDLESVTE